MLMPELLFILLPIAAASGWWVARGFERKRERHSDKNLSPAYFQGLNYLLSEQQDKAIDVFIKMVEVDSETVETHLALGHLFRRRGEVERAIRIHQNLIARPNLSLEHRANALLELGQDYMRSGLFDRAENLFLELVESKHYIEQAHRFLLQIYQQEKDWNRCVEIAGQMDPAQNEGLLNQKGHYFCELANLALKRQDIAAADDYLAQALSTDPESVRATIMLGELKQANGDHQAAIERYLKIEEQNLDFLPEVLDGITASYLALERNLELNDYLRALYLRHRRAEFLLALVERINVDEGEAAVVSLLTEQIRLNPDLRVLNKLIQYNAGDGVQEATRLLEVVEHTVNSLVVKQSDYVCEHCGLCVQKLHWLCPSCQSWQTIKLRHDPACQAEPDDQHRQAAL
jgi:lipopolysaccharide biosynthesis regulator YciM